MWIFLKDSMLSIVQDKDDVDMLMVRARLRGDIQAVFGDRTKVLETPPPADYRFRARLDRDKVTEALMNEIHGITYTNFKKSVPSMARHNAYLRVWTTMHREQEDALDDERGRGRSAAGYPGRLQQVPFDAPEWNEPSLEELCRMGDAMLGEEILHEAAVAHSRDRLGAVLDLSIDPDSGRVVSPRGNRAKPPRSSRRRR